MPYGAGVFALQSITTGSFVCEYAGQRLELQDAARKTAQPQTASTCASQRPAIHNYVLIFKEHFADGRCICTCLDPSDVGNVGRFINHSCTPNLSVHAVRVGSNPLPRIALFAARDIHVGEELTFSYHESSSLLEDEADRKPCLCGQTHCKQWCRCLANHNILIAYVTQFFLHAQAPFPSCLSSIPSAACSASKLDKV
jgi:histone-lysine N-methyltransferase SETMAR